MSIDGPLKSVLVVTEDELRVNGGRYLLQSGAAIKVRGFAEADLGSRRIIHGDALPIYILSENDVRANGGRWLLKSGQAIPMTDAIGTARGVIQGKAIPVWPVDDDGNYDPLFLAPGRIPGLELWLAADLGLSLNDGDPVTTWPDQSGNGNDAIQGVGANQPTFQDGVLNSRPVIRFDGVSEYLTSPVANPQPFTIMAIARWSVANNGYLIDGEIINRHIITGPDAATLRMFAGTLFNRAALPTNWNIIICVFDGLTSIFSINNNEATADAGARAGTELTIGIDGTEAGNPFDGDLAEMAKYNGIVSLVDRDRLADYASNKYGISI